MLDTPSEQRFDRLALIEQNLFDIAAAAAGERYIIEDLRRIFFLRITQRRRKT
jgi:hypothetical protein